MIVDYKVHYQYLSKNKLYFYDCTGNLCVAEVEDNSHLLYSSYDCEYGACPIYKKELDDTYVLLEENNSVLLYNYRTGKIISKDYDDYQFLNNEIIIVTRNDYQGLINLNNELIIETIYEQLGYEQNGYLVGYNLNFIIAQKDGKYGIISFKTGEVIEPFDYSEEQINELLGRLKEDIN